MVLRMTTNYPHLWAQIGDYMYYADLDHIAFLFTASVHTYSVMQHTKFRKRCIKFIGSFYHTVARHKTRVLEAGSLKFNVRAHT
ncbi:Hypothetical predicted protein [Octopus vulgaris]|uniref:Uncharacterized protein n=1 Tax=Octopus vulgaris TaxID=6645 RepID=A0AA36BL47_OCTVU|nr:Hypothetical predicted protein [Octopus vulgaris]